MAASVNLWPLKINISQLPELTPCKNLLSAFYSHAAKLGFLFYLKKPSEQMLCLSENNKEYL